MNNNTEAMIHSGLTIAGSDTEERGSESGHEGADDIDAEMSNSIDETFGNAPNSNQEPLLSPLNSLSNGSNNSNGGSIISQAMPCANCRKDLTPRQNDTDETTALSHAFLLRNEDQDNEAEVSSSDGIPIAAGITTVFEASLKLHKKQVSSNSRLLMCTECLSSLTELHGAYSKFMKLTLEGSFIQQLIETSILWPSFVVPRRFNFAYEDFSPLVRVKLEPNEQGEEIDLTAIKGEDPEYVVDDDDPGDSDEGPIRRPLRPLKRRVRKTTKRKAKQPKRKVVTKKSPKRKTVPKASTRKKSAPVKEKEPITRSKRLKVEKVNEIKESGSTSSKVKATKQFPCSEEGCTKSFNDEKLLRRHVKFKHGHGASPEELATRTCHECPTPKVFGIPSQLRLHQREVHATETPFPCSKCDRSFPTPNRLRIHTLLKHPSSRSTTTVSQTATAKEPLLCPHNCPTPFRSKVSLKLHLKSVHGESISYSCEMCNKTFQRSTRYRRHLKYKHGQGLTVTDLEGRSCPDCAKVFETRGQLKTHRASVHTTEKPFECDFEGCGKRFPSKNYLNIHWHMRHKKERVRYPCEHCGKSYCSKTVLQEHIETLHMGVRNIICEICGKACTRQSALNRHMETHDSTRQKLWECTICNQRFISDRTLKSHAITHSGVKDQQCTHCGDTFLHSNSLRRHLHAKHGIRPTKGQDSKESHECKQCGKTFKLKEYLSQHLRSRTHGGKGHTAQRKREITEDEEPFDGRRYKRSTAAVKNQGNLNPNNTMPTVPTSAAAAAANAAMEVAKRKLLMEPTTFEIPPPLQQTPLFWGHESLLPGTAQYFRQ